MRAALQVVRQRKPERIVMAIPVAPRATLNEFQELADEIVWLETPDPFGSVGAFYRNFYQVSDAEVIRCLEEGRAAQAHHLSITDE
jgi:predicted phosphoribosyltransferase